MIQPDYANIIAAIFEGVGAFICATNVVAVCKDKTVSGLFWQSYIFYALWSLWDVLFIYQSIDLPAGQFFALVRLVCQLAWLIAAVYYLYFYQPTIKSEVCQQS